MESTDVTESNSESTGKKINDLCNMSWLKHNSKPSEPLDTNATELIPKSQKTEDFVSRTKNVKKKRQRKSKDLNSKNSDTDTDQNSKNQEKRKPKELSLTPITVSNSTTVWNSKTNVAGTLFPDSQSQQIQILDESLQLSKALEESIITAQLEKFRLTPEKEKINWADDSDEPGWGDASPNLPEPTQQNIEESEKKMEKKPHDDNNNRDNKSSTGNDQELKRIDRFGRVDGYTERHLFMGKGARMREQHIISQQNNRSEQTSNTDRNSYQRNFQERNSDSFDNRNRGYKNFDERGSNSHDNRNRGQRDFGERKPNDNRSSNFDDGREYRNRNFQFSNQRGRYENYSHRNDDQPDKYDNQTYQRDNQSYQRDNQSYQRDNQSFQRDNQHRRYTNYQYRTENQACESHLQGFRTYSQRHDNQQRRYDNQPPKFQCRQFSNKHQNFDSSLKQEFKNPDKIEEEKIHSSPELEYDKSTIPEKIDPPKEEEKEEANEANNLEDPVISNSRTSTPLLEDESSSFTFMQESLKDDDSESYDNLLEVNDHASETMSEKSESQEYPITSTNPFQANVQPMPIHMIHQPGVICSNPDNNMPIHNEMAYKLITNPFLTSVPVSSPPHYQHPQEMVASETGCSTVPIQNMDMRYFNQHPMNLVHNHPVNSFLPVVNYPIGMPIHSCGQISQIPVGNVQGINFMHQQPVNCQQCPPQYCHSQRIPLQNLNCQSAMYPAAQFVTPITSVPLPMAPISPDQIQSIRNPQIDKMATPVTEIGRSASNLVSLCENFPARRMGYSNCPPGFESKAYSNAAQKKIIFNKEQNTLPTFRNNPRAPVQPSRRNPRKTEEFTVEKLNDIYEEIKSNTNTNMVKEEEERKTLTQWPEKSIKFIEGSYNEQLFKSYSDMDKDPSKANTQAPRPGFRIGLGRGKRLGPTT